MALLKKEEICKSCETHYILVFREQNLKDISCCPFCATPVEEEYPEEIHDEE